MADQNGTSDPRGVLIPTAFSRQELADLTGTTIETAIRIMSRWHKQQLVLTEKNGFIIANRETLVQMSLE